MRLENNLQSAENPLYLQIEMQDESHNNARIAKNTVFLYARQLILLFIGLFTSRVVLATLGFDDYGVYNAVGGVVAMFALFTGSLSSAISRFFTVGLGRGDLQKLGRIFSTSVTIQLCMAVFVAILCEIIGVWFVNRQLNIPPERLEAATWIIHFSILTFCINLISVPYNAAIVAHEKMDVFAYIGLLEGALKLGVAYALYLSSFDKLKTYAVLLTAVALIIRVIYGIYCGRHFEECRYKPIFDKSLFKEMFGYAGWNLLGTGAYLFNTQGVNIITNIFFGVVANAARGVVNQVEGIVKNFVLNFTTAINPQIMKSYAAGELKYTHYLVCRGAKFSYLLMLVFVVPFMFETECIMTLWLKNYPPEAPLFLRLSLVGTMFDLLGNSSANAAWATGKIKKYYLYVAGIGCLVFPISWVLFAIGCPAYTSYIVFAIIYLVLVFVRLWILQGLIGFRASEFTKTVWAKVLPATAVSFALSGIVYVLLPKGLAGSLAVIAVSVLFTCVASYFFGLTASERDTVIRVVKSKLNKKQ